MRGWYRAKGSREWMKVLVDRINAVTRRCSRAHDTVPCRSVYVCMLHISVAKLNFELNTRSAQRCRLSDWIVWHVLLCRRALALERAKARYGEGVVDGAAVKQSMRDSTADNRAADVWARGWRRARRILRIGLLDWLSAFMPACLPAWLGIGRSNEGPCYQPLLLMCLRPLPPRRRRHEDEQNSLTTIIDIDDNG